MKNQFSERLTEVMELNHTSQTKLAKDIGVSIVAISYWMRGKKQPLAENIYRVAEYFRVSSDYLLGLTDKM